MTMTKQKTSEQARISAQIKAQTSHKRRIIKLFSVPLTNDEIKSNQAIVERVMDEVFGHKKSPSDCKGLFLI
jgi:hypothetical protein